MKPLKQSELFDAIALALGLTGPDEREAAGFAAVRPRRVRPLKILLAEDSLVNQKLAVGLLERWGHQIRTANNGQEALAALEVEKFDLVLMDVQMPELDGLEATRMIRSREQRSGGHLPIVAMTAHAMRGDREACLSAGMDGYVAKPVRMQELYDVLESLFAEDQRGDSDGRAHHPPCSEPAPADRGTESPVDWLAAFETVQGDAELLNELIDAFRGEAAERLRDMEAAFAAEDLKTLERSAHGLKGAMRSLGVKRAADVAERLERLAHDGDLRLAGDVFATLAEQTRAVLRTLEHPPGLPSQAGGAVRPR
jgi:CheY-like chemotaxis protein/HPt (histidine-containing phosphotransfer) domain-containing protein